MTKTVDAVDEDQGVDEGSLGSPHIPVHNTFFLTQNFTAQSKKVIE